MVIYAKDISIKCKNFVENTNYKIIMDVGKEIRKQREARGLNQTSIAEAIGLDTSSYARIEKKGNKLTIEQLEKIAGALGVELLELLPGGLLSMKERRMIEEGAYRDVEDMILYYQMRESDNEKYFQEILDRYILEVAQELGIGTVHYFVGFNLKKVVGSHGVNEAFKGFDVELSPMGKRLINSRIVFSDEEEEKEVAATLLKKYGIIINILNRIAQVPFIEKEIYRSMPILVPPPEESNIFRNLRQSNR